ncbi:MAG: hypothetical protein ACTSPI_11665 [Candidatus Heimdallarchaeaceae archaeon]
MKLIIIIITAILLLSGCSPGTPSLEKQCELNGGEALSYLGEDGGKANIKIAEAIGIIKGLIKNK